MIPTSGGHPSNCSPTTCVTGANVTSAKLSTHLGVDRYGDFWLTDAIRPALHVPVIPREGFRRELFRDPRSGLKVPVLASAVSREHLFDLFLDLLRPLGETVDIVLETSHDSEGAQHRDLVREEIDLPVLMSHLCEFEELLLHDGCTGVAVLSNQAPMEIQFDEHKLLIAYAHNLEPFEKIFREYGIRRTDDLKLITEGEHMHSTEPHHEEMFEQLCCRLGVGEPASVGW